MYAVIMLPRAQRQYRAAENWWLRNRDKAPDAFDEDYEKIVELLTTSPAIGKPVRTSRRGIRRVLAERIRYYFYYRVNSRNEVEIMSVWHASRRPPKL